MEFSTASHCILCVFCAYSFAIFALKTHCHNLYTSINCTTRMQQSANVEDKSESLPGLLFSAKGAKTHAKEIAKKASDTVASLSGPLREFLPWSLGLKRRAMHRQVHSRFNP
jgi:hypothetical protein